MDDASLPSEPTTPDDPTTVLNFAPSPMLQPIEGPPLNIARAVAPWWHTLAVLFMLGAWAALGSRRTHSYGDTSHPLTYLSQIMLTWMLFGSVVAGITSRADFFFATLRRNARSFFAEVASGLGIYVSIYVGAIVVAMFAGTGMLIYRAIHHQPLTPPFQTQSTTKPNTSQQDSTGLDADKTPDTSASTQGSTSTATPLPPPPPTSPDPDPLDPLAKTRFHFNSKTVMAIAPRTPLDLLLWLFVSFTAAFCEEHIFRGYLLKQAIALGAKLRASRSVAVACSVVLTSVIFGSLHLYEGVGGAAMITVLGIVYSIIALRLGNLRAVIVAHFLQDFVAGVFLFAFNTLHPHL